MKPPLLAGLMALAIAPAIDARYMPSANGVDPVDPIIAPDLRLRLPNGHIRPDLSSAEDNRGALHLESPSLRDARPHAPRPWNLPCPKPITPEGDGEVYAPHGPRGPQMLRIAPMPMVVVDGVEIDPKMPMKTPDPTVDYKLHVLQLPPEQPVDAAAQK